MPIASLILSILGLILLIFSWIPFVGFITVGFCLIAVILGVLGRKSAAANNQPTGMATAGMVMGIIGMVIGGIVSVACMMCLNEAAKIGNDPAFKKGKEDFDREFKKAMEEAKKNQPQ